MKRAYRFFALFLSAVILIGGTCLASSGLNYTDSKQIVNQDAVLMLTDLGLVGGYPDGSFGPSDSTTRAEITKIITGILTGGGDGIVSIAAGDTDLTDVSDSWAVDYILYCYEHSIVSGNEDGTFRPEDGVTGVELAKMLLMMVGYNGEDYTGEVWEESVNDDAQALGIYKGFEKSRDTVLNRDQASLLIYNALQCPAIETWEDGVPIYYVDDLMNPVTVLEHNFNVKKYTEMVTGNEFADLTAKDSRLEPGCTKILYHKTFNVSTDLNYLGRTVSIYTLEDGTVLGKPVRSMDDLVLTLSGREFIRFLRENDIYLSAETDVYVNANSAATSKLYNLADDSDVTIIDHDGDRIIDTVLITEYKSAVVSASDPGGYTLDRCEYGTYIPLDEIAQVTGAVKEGGTITITKIGGLYYIYAK